MMSQLAYNFIYTAITKGFSEVGRFKLPDIVTANIKSAKSGFYIRAFQFSVGEFGWNSRAAFLLAEVLQFVSTTLSRLQFYRSDNC